MQFFIIWVLFGEVSQCSGNRVSHSSWQPDGQKEMEGIVLGPESGWAWPVISAAMWPFALVDDVRCLCPLNHDVWWSAEGKRPEASTVVSPHVYLRS